MSSRMYERLFEFKNNFNKSNLDSLISSLEQILFKNPNLNLKKKKKVKSGPNPTIGHRNVTQFPKLDQKILCFFNKQGLYYKKKKKLRLMKYSTKNNNSDIE